MPMVVLLEKFYLPASKRRLSTPQFPDLHRTSWRSRSAPAHPWAPVDRCILYSVNWQYVNQLAVARLQRIVCSMAGKD